MIKTYIQSLKCCNCNKSIGENAPIIESKAMVGTYLTVCPHCVTELITAGQNLVKIPEQMSINMRDELINGISNMAIKEVEESNLPDSAKDIIGDFLYAIKDGLETKPVKEGNIISFKKSSDIDKAKESSTSQEKATYKEEDNTTAYAVLLDGDVYDEYTKDTPIKDIFVSMIEEFGEEAVANGNVKLCELKEIKPKFKKKVTYVLDM